MEFKDHPSLTKLTEGLTSLIYIVMCKLHHRISSEAIMVGITRMINSQILLIDRFKGTLIIILASITEIAITFYSYLWT